MNRFMCGIMLLFSLTGVVMAQATKTGTNENHRLRSFLEAEWKYWVTEYPELATAVGYPGQNDRWTDYSPAAIGRRNQHLRGSLKKLAAIHRARLSSEERLNYDLYRSLLEAAVEGLRYHHDALPIPQVTPQSLLMPLNQMDGIQQGIGRVIAITPAKNLRDYQNILARLEAVPVVVDQNIALMQEGLRRKWTPPRITLRDVAKQVEDQILADPMASPLLDAFRKFPTGVPESERAKLTQRGVAAYQDKFVPAFRKLYKFLVETYLPACREEISVAALPADPSIGLPSGAEMYTYLVHWYTTTKLTPRQIHEKGLAEVKRIRAEMDKAIAASGFKGSFAEFTQFLRTDPQFYFTKPEDLLTASRDIAKRADPELAHLFGRLPQLPYGVKPVPDAIAPSQTTAYYEPGSLVAGRPAWYFVNTYDLPARPKWEMEALSLHEAVPGHHLQITLAQELAGLPEFRKHSGYTAYVEGWGLYSEMLGEEMDFYRDPYSKFGQLTYEMWRAIRLVVDTGMHSMGWSRQRAVDFFEQNSGKTGHDIVVEVDRYIVWPGQALGYKIGELKLRELRAAAQRELGERFDVRRFHDEVLGQGALPLDLLEARIKTWVARQMKPRSMRAAVAAP